MYLSRSALLCVCRNPNAWPISCDIVWIWKRKFSNRSEISVIFIIILRRAPFLSEWPWKICPCQTIQINSDSVMWSETNMFTSGADRKWLLLPVPNTADVTITARSLQFSSVASAWEKIFEFPTHPRIASTLKEWGPDVRTFTSSSHSFPRMAWKQARLGQDFSYARVKILLSPT